MQRLNQHKKDMLNSIKLDVAHRNQAMAYRHGVVGARMGLRCATYMDEKPSEFHNTMEHTGVVVEDKQAQRQRYSLHNNKTLDFEVEEDTATMVEFRNHFEGRKQKAIRAERRKGTFIERYRAWKQRMRERFINYDYE